MSELVYRRGVKRAVLTSFAVLSLTSAGLAACFIPGVMDFLYAHPKL